MESEGMLAKESGPRSRFASRGTAPRDPEQTQTTVLGERQPLTPRKGCLQNILGRWPLKNWFWRDFLMKIMGCLYGNPGVHPGPITFLDSVLYPSV